MEQVPEVKETNVFTGKNFTYREVAKREADRLAITVDYVIHPQGVGFLAVRFVAWSGDGKVGSFKHLKMRDAGEFNKGEFKFEARRFEVFPIPAFKPAPLPMAFMKLADNYQIFDITADWINERIKNEGFELTLEEGETLTEVVRKLVGGEYGVVNNEQYELLMNFPEVG